jgi:two-component system, cell cycle sensor histidine kinase and response regulator CckA
VPNFDPANFAILVVDDEAAVRSLITNVLRRAGYQVFDAANGEDAVEKLKGRAGPIHLLLTDCVMPGMSGVELAAAARKHGWAATVLVISGYVSSQVAAEDQQFDFLQKPMAPNQLLDKVRELLFRSSSPEV